MGTQVLDAIKSFNQDLARKIGRLSSTPTSRAVLSIVLITGFTFVGFKVQSGLKAATPTSAVQAESGTASANASIINDTSASGAQAVKFGDGTVATCANAIHTPGGSDGAGGCWPYSGNTGVPAGTVLSAYAGTNTCNLTTANVVINAKTFNCDIVVKAANIKITNSNILGRVVSDTNGASITIEDSKIDGGQQETFPAVSYINITLRRVEVIGAQHSVQCTQTCDVEDSWLHAQYIPNNSAGHVNAFISNGGNGFILRHNSLFCSVQPTNVDGGCTADMSLFGDFGPIANVTIDNNLFVANSTGASYCLYAGHSPAKQYPTPTNIDVINNVFQRGSNNQCGIYGPVTSFLVASGNTWSNNVWSNGGAVPSSD